MNIIRLLAILSAMAFTYGGDSSAGEVQAPPSIKGATITIKFEEGDFMRSKTLKYDKIIESEYGEFIYIPKGASALISFGYTIINSHGRFFNYTVSGEDRHSANFEENPKPATITFIGKADGVYHGKFQGYRTCDRWPNCADKLVSITITLPNHVKEPNRE